MGDCNGKKKAKDCPCCMRRVGMGVKRIRESLTLWDEDMRADGASAEFRKHAVEQVSKSLEAMFVEEGVV